jgi:F-type H+-transporting ATPase subunit b
MVPFVFAEEATGSGISALGISPSAFLIQLISFVFVFLLLKKFAFGPIIKLLAERRKVIDDGVRMGLRMEKEKAKLDTDVAKAMSEARHEADKIILLAQKEAREITREAEKLGQRKADAMIADAQARLEEEARQAKKNLEKDIVGLVSEATEAIVGEKVDAKKDAEIIDKALKGRKK